MSEAADFVVVLMSYSEAQRRGLAEDAEDPDEFAKARARALGWRPPP
jgi:hypothetical protein